MTPYFFAAFGVTQSGGSGHVVVTVRAPSFISTVLVGVPAPTGPAAASVGNSPFSFAETVRWIVFATPPSGVGRNDTRAPSGTAWCVMSPGWTCSA